MKSPDVIIQALKEQLALRVALRVARLEVLERTVNLHHQDAINFLYKGLEALEKRPTESTALRVSALEQAIPAMTIRLEKLEKANAVQRLDAHGVDINRLVERVNTLEGYLESLWNAMPKEYGSVVFSPTPEQAKILRAALAKDGGQVYGVPFDKPSPFTQKQAAALMDNILNLHVKGCDWDKFHRLRDEIISRMTTVGEEAKDVAVGWFVSRGDQGFHWASRGDGQWWRLEINAPRIWVKVLIYQGPYGQSLDKYKATWPNESELSRVKIRDLFSAHGVPGEAKK